MGAGIAFALDGRPAEIVLRWVQRGHAPLRRPLEARIAKPPEVPLSDWASWSAAVSTRQPMELVPPLRVIRKSAPDFLSTEPSLEATWLWLQGHPGAVAVAAIQASPFSLVVILRHGQSGTRRVQVLAVPLPAPPVEGEELFDRLGAVITDPATAASTHGMAAQWAGEGLVEPVLRFLGERPTALLWCPSRLLRAIAPSAIWGDIPVAMTAGLPLHDLSTAPPRPRSTLVILADPASGDAALGPAGLESFQRLVEKARARGRATGVGSVGVRHGPELIGGISQAPASVEALLARIPDHDVLVAIAHGQADSPETAALLLVGRHGSVEPLDVAMLQQHSDRFTGLTIILLSCESGRVFDSFHDPGGVAGALVAAGARAVVAPLWPVRLDVAEDLAQAVLDGLAEGLPPWQALAAARPERTGGPALGPAPSLGSQRAATSLQCAAFVTWVG